jgi:hypothetical protein
MDSSLLSTHARAAIGEQPFVRSDDEGGLVAGSWLIAAAIWRFCGGLGQTSFLREAQRSQPLSVHGSLKKWRME